MRVSLRRLATLFARVGNLTFGGGDPTMAVLYTELVISRRWLAPEKYGLVYALARITPGTNLLAFCAGAGWEIAGWTGAVVAVSAVTLPSTAAVVFLTAGYEVIRRHPLALAAVSGTLAAAVGLMAAGSWQLLRPNLAAGAWVRAVVLAGGAFALTQLRSPIEVLVLAAAAGFLWPGAKSA